MQTSPKRTVLVACRVMEPELEELRRERCHAEVLYLEQSLHRTPQKMAERVQALIDQAAGRAQQIVLGYGLCSNGIVGVKARQQGLIVPRCHDCISFFLGSPQAYRKDFDAHPGTYYLTPGWLAERKDPLGLIAEYEPRYGRETAEWVVREELKNYTRIVFINSGIGDVQALRQRARDNADFLNMRYEEITGDCLPYFKKLFDGPYSEDEFIRIPPEAEITQEIFLSEMS